MKLDTLTDDQQQGFACVTCGCSSGGPMATLPTDDSTSRLASHVDLADCVRNIARYTATLHTHLIDQAEDARDRLAGLVDEDATAC